MPQKRILLIDDDEGIREVTQVALEVVGGWNVETAHSGAEGLRKAAAGHPDAILLDVMMPDMDGPTALARLHDDARTHKIPVVFLTAKAHPSEQRRLGELGVAGILTKPFDPLTLSDDVARALGWS